MLLVSNELRRAALARWDILRRLELRLLRTGRPRIQMLGVVTASGAAGVLASATLLHLHLCSMWLRYPLSVTAGYGAFLLLIWLWIIYYRRKWNRIMAGRAAGRRLRRDASGDNLQPGEEPPESESRLSDLLDLFEA